MHATLLAPIRDNCTHTGDNHSLVINHSSEVTHTMQDQGLANRAPYVRTYVRM